jgi:tRNA threonylcarbamoyl adenosine modification protein YeaZ
VLILAVDTSSAQVSAAVVEVSEAGEVKPLATRETVAANRHGELLAPSVHSVLETAGVGVADLGAVAAGLGPGPFTGLRVGVVTAATIADAVGIASYGACSLDAIARPHAGDGNLLVCTDARRRQVYWAVYDATGERLEGPDIAPPADVMEHARGRVTRVVGAGAHLYADIFAELSVDADAGFPSAVQVAAIVAPKAQAGAPSDVLEPLYLRRPDAVPPAAPKAVTPA